MRGDLQQADRESLLALFCLSPLLIQPLCIARHDSVVSRVLTCCDLQFALCQAPAAGRTGVTGKELVLLFNSGLRSNGTWFADSNGREMVKRERNRRGPNYPPYVVGEPVAGN